MIFSPRTLILSLSLSLFMTTGCNVMAGFEEEASSVQHLMEDAEIALQQDHPDKAVTYLKKALAQDSTNKKVRIKLATARLEQDDISVLDFTTLSDKINAELQSMQSAAGKTGPGICSFPATSSYEPFDPAQISNFDKLETHQSTLQEVQHLIDKVLFGSEGSSGARSQENVQQAVERLRGDELSDVHIAEALLNDALAYLVLAYVNVANQGSDDLSFFYVNRPGGGRGYIGYCAPDQETLDELLGAVACHLDELGYAVRLIQARAYLLGSEQALEIARKAEEAYAKLTEQLEASCSSVQNLQAAL